MARKVPSVNKLTKPIPLTNKEQIKVPLVTQHTMLAPYVTEPNTPIPLYSNQEIPAPLSGHILNMIKIGDKYILIKPTKLKYQRDRSAAFYRVLQKVPIVDLLSLPDNYFDDVKSPDKMLFDWIVAVLDDPDFVTLNYDLIDADNINLMVKIFCRLNHILDKEERKNQATQVTSH